MNVGDKVVCVDDSPCCYCHTPIDLLSGQVYVVSGIRICYVSKNLVLDILGLKPTCHGIGQAYNAKRFRKLDELKEETRQRQLKEQGQTV